MSDDFGHAATETITIDHVYVEEATHIWQRLTCEDRLSPGAPIEGKESNWPLWSSVFPSTQLLPYWDHFIDTSNVESQKGHMALGEGCLSSLANTTSVPRLDVCVCVCVCVCVSLCVCGSRGAVCHLQAAELHRCQQGQTIPRLH